MRQTEAMVADAPARRLSYRSLDQLDELEEAAGLVVSVWGEGSEALASVGLLRAYTQFGNPVIGAFDGEHLCGVSIGFLALDGGLHLHSHVTGVLPSHQHAGIGLELKAVQRDWCLHHGIDHVTWTFDPLLSRNAHFNIRKLGAVSGTLLRDFYGPMDDELNRGSTTDRLEVHWPIAAERVEQSIAAARDTPGTDAGQRPAPWTDAALPPPAVRTVPVPGDYLALRTSDPAEAKRRRQEVCDELAAAFAEGLTIVDFTREAGYHLANVVHDGEPES